MYASERATSRTEPRASFVHQTFSDGASAPSLLSLRTSSNPPPELSHRIAARENGTRERLSRSPLPRARRADGPSAGAHDQRASGLSLDERRALHAQMDALRQELVNRLREEGEVVISGSDFFDPGSAGVPEPRSPRPQTGADGIALPQRPHPRPTTNQTGHNDRSHPPSDSRFVLLPLRRDKGEPSGSVGRLGTSAGSDRRDDQARLPFQPLRRAGPAALTATERIDPARDHRVQGEHWRREEIAERARRVVDEEDLQLLEQLVDRRDDRDRLGAVAQGRAAHRHADQLVGRGTAAPGPRRRRAARLSVPSAAVRRSSRGRPRRARSRPARASRCRSRAG